MAQCKHSKQVVLTLRLDTEILNKQKDGALKADPHFTSRTVEIAKKCKECGEIVSRTDSNDIQALVKTATEEFFVS